MYASLFTIPRALAKITLPVLLLALPAGASTSLATTGYGYKKLILPATGLQAVTNYLSVPLTNPPVYSAGVATIIPDTINVPPLGSSTLTVAGTPWTSGQFAAAGTSYFLKFSTGKQAGRFLHIKGNTANSLTVDITDQSTQLTGLDAANFAVQVGDNFQIVPGETLASFLGDGSTGNPVLLQGSTSVFTAETVSIYQPTLARSLSYYFNTSTMVWTCSTVTGSQNALPLYPETVLCVTRHAGDAALDITNEGNLPDVAPLTKTIGGNNLIFASTRYPVDETLASFSLAGWVKGTSTFTVDTVSIWDQPTARFYAYYQLPNTTVNGVTVPGQWRRSGDTLTDYSSFPLPSGLGFEITKRAVVSGAASFLTSPLPTAP